MNKLLEKSLKQIECERYMTLFGYKEEYESAQEMQAQWEQEEQERQLQILQEFQDAEDERILNEVHSSMMQDKRRF